MLRRFLAAQAVHERQDDERRLQHLQGINQPGGDLGDMPENPRVVSEARLLEHDKQAAVVADTEVLVATAAQDPGQALYTAVDCDEQVTDAGIQQHPANKPQGSRHVLIVRLREGPQTMSEMVGSVWVEGGKGGEDRLPA
jgi:hypothetical protein